MATANVLYTEEASVAVIALNRPNSLNAFTRSMGHEIHAAMCRAAEARSVRAVVLTGAGRGFSAGADLKEGFPTREDVRVALDEEYNPGIIAITQIPKPVVAAVQGFASGIALSYVLACDLVVMGESAFVQVPFVNIALVPDGGLCWQLVAQLGHRLAFEMAVDGARFSAARCLTLGLANRVVDDDKVVDDARAWAAQLACKAPLATAGIKRLMRQAASLPLKDIMDRETKQQQDCIASNDHAEGVRAFLEKRRVTFAGK